MKAFQALTAAAAVALLAAACGGTGSRGSPNGGASDSSASANSQLLAYASCMRSDGVATFPDPTSTGFPKATLDQLAGSNPRYSTASQGCAHLLGSSGGGPTQAEVQQEWTGIASFGRCMRSHGVVNWPGPTAYPPDPSRPTIDLPSSVQPTQQVIATLDECLRLVPNNAVVGHIDSPSWQSTQQQMAGQ
jgi:hypothetical protein